MLTAVKKIITRKGQPMLFATLEDLHSEVEAIVFPKTLEETPTLWIEDNILLVEGKVDDKDGEIKILVNKAKLFDLQKLSDRKVLVVVPEKIKKTKFEELKKLMVDNPGPNPAYLLCQGRQINTKLAISPEIWPALEKLLGPGSLHML